MISVAVDGPAGAGKSTICRRAARQLGFVYVDTGALYRAVGLFVLRQGVDPTDNEAVQGLLKKLTLDLQFEGGEQQVLLGGENVTGLIRTPEVSMAASRVSAVPAVRDFLFETQRRLAREHDVVMDGRDIGTAVLPDATLKVYLTASSRVRAGRRYKELTERGESCSLEAIEQDIIERDYRDMHRELSPLKQAEDAILLDTSELDFEEVMREMEKLVEAAKKKQA